MSEIKTKYDPVLKRYTISGHISDMDLYLNTRDIVQEVRYNITQEIIDHMAAKLRDRLESELDKALDTMFQEKRG